MTLKNILSTYWTLRAYLERHILSDHWVVKRRYYRVNQCYPDLENPKDFTEKICWIKLNGITELHKRCANKITARDYVAELLGPETLIPQVLITHDVEDLNPETITQRQFVIKANHDSGSVIACHDRAEFDWALAREKMSRALKRKFHHNHVERQYSGFEPAIIVEKMLKGKDGETSA